MTPVPSDDQPPKKRGVNDYIFGKIIGQGSFSHVYLAKDIHTNKEFAIKVLQKQQIINENKQDYVNREKNALLRLASCSSLFVRLYATFQDSDRLYFVLTKAKNGDLLGYINKGLSLECARYYAAELVLALEVLKAKHIIHRDLKPENILLDEHWHILITDFGSSKIESADESAHAGSEERRRNSFVGTAQYVTPEVLSHGRVAHSADLWAFGCILFQMIAGAVPFSAPTDYLIFRKILELNYEFPAQFDATARDLVTRLLVLEPQLRLGADDERPYSSLRSHEFFAGVGDWEHLGTPPMVSMEQQQEEVVEVLPEINNMLKPGFDDHTAFMLMFNGVKEEEAVEEEKEKEKEKEKEASPAPKKPPNIVVADAAERERRLKVQRADKWHAFVEGNLILKQGLIDKRKGLFPKRRMLLLTHGPHLYYVDPEAMVLKGEIPWSSELKAEAKTFKTFHVHTPNRIYYLEDPGGYALDWCKSINDVKAFYYPDTNEQQ